MEDENTAIAATMRAVVYIRVNERAVGDAEAVVRQIERQRARCQEVASQHGLSVIAEYADRGGAVRLEHRPELTRLLEELPQTQARYVIAGDGSRLSRNAREMVAIERRLIEVGAELLVWGEGEVHAKLRRRMVEMLSADEAQQTTKRRSEGDQA